MSQTHIGEADLAALIERVSVAANAYISGDMDTYFSLIHHADDFTLMSPFGGEPERGFDTSPERIAALKQFFRGGKAEVEVVQTYVSGDLVVLVVVERQRGEVGGLPGQDWSLRVTRVFHAWCDLRSVRSPLDEASDGQIGLPGVTVEPDAGVVQRHLGREPSEEAAQSMGTLMFQPEVV